MSINVLFHGSFSTEIAEILLTHTSFISDTLEYIANAFDILKNISFEIATCDT